MIISMFIIKSFLIADAKSKLVIYDPFIYYYYKKKTLKLQFSVISQLLICILMVLISN